MLHSFREVEWYITLKQLSMSMQPCFPFEFERWYFENHNIIQGSLEFFCYQSRTLCQLQNKHITPMMEVRFQNILIDLPAFFIFLWNHLKFKVSATPSESSQVVRKITATECRLITTGNVEKLWKIDCTIVWRLDACEQYIR